MSSIQTMPPTRSKRRKPAFQILFIVKSVWSLVGEKKPASASAPIETSKRSRSLYSHYNKLRKAGVIIKQVELNNLYIYFPVSNDSDVSMYLVKPKTRKADL